MEHSPADHFEGKSVIDHLRDARLRAMGASAEIHGIEMPGHISAYADSSKDTALALLLFWTAAYFLISETACFHVMILFSAGWWVWKTSRCALMGWGRLNRLHRLIEEERWEIEHHRAQEKEELIEMYRAKGLSGKLLDEVVEILMSDDNRLLQIMLEEEMGLTLQAHEHPLRESLGAALGSACTAILLLAAYGMSPSYGLPIASCLILIIASVVSAKIERNNRLPAVIWTLAVAALAAGSVYFLTQLLIKTLW